MIDYSLYLVTDRSLAMGRETVNICARTDGVPVDSAIGTAACPRKAAAALRQQIQSAREGNIRNENYGTA